MVVGKRQGIDDVQVQLASRGEEPLRSGDAGQQQHASARRQGPAHCQTGCLDPGRSAESGSLEPEVTQRCGKLGSGSSGLSREDRGIGPSNSCQRLAQTPTGKQASACEGVVDGEDEEIDVPEQAEMGETVVQNEGFRSGLQSFEGVPTGFESICADHHRHTWKLAGQEYGLVTGDFRTEQGSLAGADDAHATASAPIASRENRRLYPPITKMPCHSGHQRSLPGSSPMQVADTDDWPRQPFRALRVPAPASGVSRSVEPLPGRPGRRDSG